MCRILCLVSQSCLTLCESKDCSWPDSSVHGDSLGKNTGVGCHAFLQRIFPIQGLNPGLPHCRQILYCLHHQGSPRILEWGAYPFSRGFFQPRDWTGVSCIADRFFTNWATRAAPIGLHRTDQLPCHQWLGHRLWLLWCWMVCLGNELKLFCCFWDWTHVLHFLTLLLTVRATTFL